jgi:hypothetical protein
MTDDEKPATGQTSEERLAEQLPGLPTRPAWAGGAEVAGRRGGAT